MDLYLSIQSIWAAFIIVFVHLYVNVLMYIVAIKQYIKDKYIITSIISLIAIPFYVASFVNDFCMRASMPALFILMIYVIKSLIDNKNKWLITILVVIGMVTPFNEIFMSVNNIIRGTEPVDIIYSYSNINTRTKQLYKVQKEVNSEIDYTFILDDIISQILAEDYQDTTYYKYIMKHNE